MAYDKLGQESAAAARKEQATKALKSLLERLNEHGSKPTAVVGVHSRAVRPSERSVTRLEMDVELGGRMREAALAPIIHYGPKWLENDLLEPFDHRGTQEEDVRFLLADEIADVQRWFQSIPPIGTWPPFSKAAWEQRQLSGIFCIIQFPDGSEPVIAFARWSENLLMRRKGILSSIKENIYSLQPLNGAIYLPNSFDFFLSGGIIFAHNWKNFEASVNYREIAKSQAKENWTAFHGALPVHGEEKVWEVIEKSARHQNTINKAFARANRITPTIARIEKFIQERKLNITCEDGKLVIDATDKTQIIHLMTIIADGYVTSDLTDTHLRTFDAEPIS